jgi:hypothetical protein
VFRQELRGIFAGQKAVKPGRFRLDAIKSSHSSFLHAAPADPPVGFMG